MALKFGKRPPKFNPRTLLMAKYVPAALAPPPAKRAWEYAVSDAEWAQSMLGNDAVGDCVIAAMLHFIMAATANTNQPITFTTQDALDIYSAITGYDPSQTDGNGNNPTDQGTSWTDALTYWQTTGCKGHKILGWAAIDYTNLMQIRQGIALFGAVLIGTAITQSMMDQFSAGEPWNPPYTGGILGLHGVPWLGYGSLGETCLSWAQRVQMAMDALSQADEAYIVVTQDFMDAQGTSPSGLNLAALQADLAALKA